MTMMFSATLVPSPPSRIPLSFSNHKSPFHGIRIANLRPIQTPPSLHRNPSFAVMRAKREEELKEIQSKTTEEIKEEIVDLKGELFMLRLQKSACSEFGSMLTVRREREIVEGINKRLSIKLDWKWKKSIVVRSPSSSKKMQEEQKAAEAEKWA